MIKTGGFPIDAVFVESVEEEFKKLNRELRFRILMSTVFLLGVVAGVFIILLGGISKNRYDISVLQDKTEMLSHLFMEVQNDR